MLQRALWLAASTTEAARAPRGFAFVKAELRSCGTVSITAAISGPDERACCDQNTHAYNCSVRERLSLQSMQHDMHSKCAYSPEEINRRMKTLPERNLLCRYH
jgi:hypothetical protein